MAEAARERPPAGSVWRDMSSRSAGELRKVTGYASFQSTEPAAGINSGKPLVLHVPFGGSPYSEPQATPMVEFQGRFTREKRFDQR
jgi:hypothetical protein